MEVCGYLGLNSAVGTEIVNAVKDYGWALAGISFAAFLLSGASLSALSVGTTYIISMVKYYLEKYTFLKAVAW